FSGWLDEWNEGKQLDQQKRRVASLEPGKVIINEFPSQRLRPFHAPFWFRN
ncbi:hypothetical protein HAX54_019162, partial [Datura stramonium]|nr:hypothetical protein [Datura stramonium]